MSEFSKEIVVDGLRHYPGGIFVIYEWDWVDQLDIEKHQMATSISSSTTYPSAHSLASSYHSDSPQLPHVPKHQTQVPAVIHAIVFKCIGAVRDEQQQKVLEEAYTARQTGEVVPVKLEPEPENPYDSQAISFMCQIRGVWKRIGYVVRECLDDVHAAIAKGEIVQVEFAWVKYLLQWTRSGPGFYAGITITRKGQWSSACIRSASTR